MLCTASFAGEAHAIAALFLVLTLAVLSSSHVAHAAFNLPTYDRATRISVVGEVLISYGSEQDTNTHPLTIPIAEGSYENGRGVIEFANATRGEQRIMVVTDKYVKFASRYQTLDPCASRGSPTPEQRLAGLALQPLISRHILGDTSATALMLASDNSEKNVRGRRMLLFQPTTARKSYPVGTLSVSSIKYWFSFKGLGLTQDRQYLESDRHHAVDGPLSLRMIELEFTDEPENGGMKSAEIHLASIGNAVSTNLMEEPKSCRIPLSLPSVPYPAKNTTSTAPNRQDDSMSHPFPQFFLDMTAAIETTYVDDSTDREYVVSTLSSTNQGYSRTRRVTNHLDATGRLLSRIAYTSDATDMSYVSTIRHVPRGYTRSMPKDIEDYFFQPDFTCTKMVMSSSVRQSHGIALLEGDRTPAYMGRAIVRGQLADYWQVTSNDTVTQWFFAPYATDPFTSIDLAGDEPKPPRPAINYWNYITHDDTADNSRLLRITVSRPKSERPPLFVHHPFRLDGVPFSKAYAADACARFGSPPGCAKPDVDRNSKANTYTIAYDFYGYANSEGNVIRGIPSECRKSSHSAFYVNGGHCGGSLTARNLSDVGIAFLCLLFLLVGMMVGGVFVSCRYRTLWYGSRDIYDRLKRGEMTFNYAEAVHSASEGGASDGASSRAQGAPTSREGEELGVPPSTMQPEQDTEMAAQGDSNVPPPGSIVANTQPSL